MEPIGGRYEKTSGDCCRYSQLPANLLCIDAHCTHPAVICFDGTCRCRPPHYGHATLYVDNIGQDSATLSWKTIEEDAIAKLAEKFNSKRFLRFGSHMDFGDYSDLKHVPLLFGDYLLRLYYRDEMTVEELALQFQKITGSTSTTSFLNILTRYRLDPRELVESVVNQFYLGAIQVEGDVNNWQGRDERHHSRQLMAYTLASKERLEKRYYTQIEETTLPLYIRTNEGAELRVEAQPSQTIRELMDQLIRENDIEHEHFRLIYGKKLLLPSKRVHDYQLAPMSRLKMMIKQVGGCLHHETTVITRTKGRQPIIKVVVGEEALAYNQKSHKFEWTAVLHAERVDARYSILVYIEDGRRLRFTASHRFMCQNGYWHSLHVDRHTKRLVVGDRIAGSERFWAVTKITKEKHPSTVFCNISTKLKNLLANCLVAYAMVLRMECSHGDRITIPYNPADTAERLLEQFYRQHPWKHLTDGVFYHGNRLDRQRTLADYGVASIEVLRILQANPYNKPHPKWVIVRKNRMETCSFAYDTVEGFTAKELIEAVIESTIKLQSLLFAGNLVSADQLISSFVQTPRVDTILGFQLISFEKFEFYRGLSHNTTLKLDRYEMDQQESTIIRNFRQELYRRRVPYHYSQEHFYQPITMYTCDFIYRKLNSWLNYLNLGSRNQEDPMHEFASCLVNSLKCLPVHIGMVYRGINRYKHSALLKEGQVFNWSRFSSTSLELKVAYNFTKTYGTVFCIKCLTGREISSFSVYPDEREVLLLPHTYLLTERIETRPNYEFVVAAELPSPFSLTNNILLWVDDHHKHNLNLLKAIAKYTRGSLVVLQLTSSKAAEAWMREFGWLFAHTDRSIKLVTDMVRYYHGKYDLAAGVQLVRMMRRHGFSLPMLIFCWKLEMARQNSQLVKATEEELSLITNNTTQFLEFVVSHKSAS